MDVRQLECLVEFIRMWDLWGDKVCCLQLPCFYYYHLLLLLLLCVGDAYNVHDRCVASGYDNGDIKLFDLRAMTLRWETNVKNGVSSTSAIKPFDLIKNGVSSTISNCLTCGRWHCNGKLTLRMGSVASASDRLT